MSQTPLKMNRSTWLRLALTLFVGLALPVAQAQPNPGDRADPPARVARVTDVVGDAWLFDDENKEWTRLMRNQTIAEGDRLRTDDRARVALSAGSTAIFLDEGSDLVLDRFDEGTVRLQLDRGDLAVQLRSADAARDMAVQTREGLFQPERDGLYRIEQLDRGSLARAWSGRLRFDPVGSGANSWVEQGEQVEFWSVNGSQRAERMGMRSDAFGDWVTAQSREGGLSVASQRYVSPEMTGAEDLDRYGAWDQSPEYGAVWYPTSVGSDWVPYRYGRWMWTRYWGWSWVDDSPWGFAPFHYGRWVQWRGRWGWAPGSFVARPVYAPALVAFVGGPSISFGVSFQFGGRRPPRPDGRWVPLAPRESYVPPYRHSNIYAQRLNGSRDIRPVQQPRNAGVNGAISHGAIERPMPAPRPAADMQWRGPNRGERDRDNAWGRERGREDRGGSDNRNDRNDRGQFQQNQQPNPQRPQPAVQQPQVQQPQVQQPQRSRDERVNQQREQEQRREQDQRREQLQQQQQLQQQAHPPGPVAQPQQPGRTRDERIERVERAERDDPDRQQDRRGFGRGQDRQQQQQQQQQQPQVQQQQPQPQPQPAFQPPVQRPQPQVQAPAPQPQAQQPQPQPRREEAKERNTGERRGKDRDKQDR